MARGVRFSAAGDYLSYVPGGVIFAVATVDFTLCGWSTIRGVVAAPGNWDQCPGYVGEASKHGGFFCTGSATSPYQEAWFDLDGSGFDGGNAAVVATDENWFFAISFDHVTQLYTFRWAKDGDTSFGSATGTQVDWTANGTLPDRIELGHNPGGDNPLNGDVTNWKAFTRYLDDAQLLAEMKHEAVVDATGLYGHWKLPNASDLTDDSGNGRTLSANGTIADGTQVISDLAVVLTPAAAAIAMTTPDVARALLVTVSPATIVVGLPTASATEIEIPDPTVVSLAAPNVTRSLVLAADAGSVAVEVALLSAAIDLAPSPAIVSILAPAVTTAQMIFPAPVGVEARIVGPNIPGGSFLGPNKSGRVGRSTILLGLQDTTAPARVTRSGVIVGRVDTSALARVSRSSVMLGYVPVLGLSPLPVSVQSTVPPSSGGPSTILFPVATAVMATVPNVRLGSGLLLNALPASVSLDVPPSAGPIRLALDPARVTARAAGVSGIGFGQPPPPAFPCDATAQPAYAEALRALLPWGLAWTRQEGSRLSQLLMALAHEIACLRSRAVTLLVEADPRTSSEMLPDWERNLGLPDPCAKGTGNLGDRRRDLVARFIEGGTATPSYLVQYAFDLGFVITIEELDTFVAGVSVAGDRLNNIGKPFRAGYSVAGDRLDNDTGNEFTFLVHAEYLLPPERARLECAMARVIPAHVRAAYDYPYLLQPVPTRVSLSVRPLTRG